jgi:hypothetical protein
MSSKDIPAFDRDALYAKSQLFIRRALRAKTDGDHDLYHLWCSLALELLGKASLANVSPALVADPTHRDSLFAACGKVIGSDLKSITAKTVFERLPFVTKRFDAYTTRFCEQLAYRRNADLHSGEAPFAGMKLAAWERQFWHAAEVVLSAQAQTLEGWLGADAAAAPKEVLQHASEATANAVPARIESHRLQFNDAHKSDKQRKAAIEVSQRARVADFRSDFDFELDLITPAQCPACKATAALGASLWEEEVLDDYDPDAPEWESVEKTYLVEALYCPTCELKLNSRQEVAAAGFDEEFKETEERERTYEPDYGND